MFRSSFNEKFVNIRQLFHCFDSCSSLRPRVGEVDIKAQRFTPCPNQLWADSNKAVDNLLFGKQVLFHPLSLCLLTLENFSK